ncbi:MAG: ArsR/SmtB family transcription factor [Candidatus Acidiferrales bacterium]
MNEIYPIASVAELIGEPARAAMLVGLLSGRALPAGELARLAGVSAQSASAHLSKLVLGGLLVVQSRGRYRYYKIADSRVAHAVEALGSISTRPRHANAPQSRDAMALRDARSCYDHFAGRIAVEVTEKLETLKVIRRAGNRNYELGPEGPEWFANLGVDVELVRRSRREFALQCLDWTERRSHLAGSLGAALFLRLLDLGWIARRRETRAMRVTHRGANEFRAQFGIAA